MLGGAPAGEDRDPHSSSSSGVGRRPACRRRSSPIRRVRARSPAAGTGRSRGRLCPGLRFLLLPPSARGRRRAPPAPLRRAACRSRSAPSPAACRQETTIATVEPASTSLPALGDWLITSPAGESLSSSETLGFEAAAADLLHRDAALAADQDRDLDQLRAAGDERGSRRAVGRGAAGRRFGVDHQPFFDRVGVDRFDVDFEAGRFELFVALLRRARRSPGPCCCRARR